jgi:hypothetical protein
VAQSLLGALREGAQPIADPLASVPYPPYTHPPAPVITQPGVYGPGYYAGIDINTGVVQLKPGIYVIRGPLGGIGAKGLEVKGDALLSGTEVCIYLRDGAEMRTAGHGSVDLTPPKTGPWQGVTIFLHRGIQGLADIHGLGRFKVEGTIYLADGRFDATGDVGREIGRLIAKTVEIRGDADIEFSGKGVYPAPREYVFLVE